MSNNKVRDWSEVDRLSSSTKLEELLLMGNPLTPATSTPEYRMEASIFTLLKFPECQVKQWCESECRNILLTQVACSHQTMKS